MHPASESLYKAFARVVDMSLDVRRCWKTLEVLSSASEAEAQRRLQSRETTGKLLLEVT